MLLKNVFVRLISHYDNSAAVCEAWNVTQIKAASTKQEVFTATKTSVTCFCLVVNTSNSCIDVNNTLNINPHHPAVIEKLHGYCTLFFGQLLFVPHLVFSDLWPCGVLLILWQERLLPLKVTSDISCFMTLTHSSLVISVKVCRLLSKHFPQSY